MLHQSKTQSQPAVANPKSEAPNPKQIQHPKHHTLTAAEARFAFRILHIRVCFVCPISDFGFPRHAVHPQAKLLTASANSAWQSNSSCSLVISRILTQFSSRPASRS